MLLSFPTPASIAKLSVEQFRDQVWESMGHRVHKQAKIEEIHSLAVRSIALPVDPDSTAVMTFRLQLTRYLHLCQMRSELEQQADALLAAHPDYQRLRTVPGIGPITALIILAEAGDLRRFGHHRQFLSSVVWIWPRANRVRADLAIGSPSAATPAFDAHYGSQQ